MLTKRTAIGIGVGSAIIVIGIASFFLHLGIQTIEVDDKLDLGDSTSYRLMAPAHSYQFLKITGEKFELKMESPGDGLQIPLTPHAKEIELEWTHLIDGETRINIQNTGNSELQIIGTVQVSTDPLFITYDIMVAIAGMVIIGFSLGFSFRKPRGF